MISRRLLHLCAFVVCFLGWALCPKAAWAFPNGVFTGDFPVAAEGCNNSGCHGFDPAPGGNPIGPDPTFIQVRVNGGGLQNLSGNTLAVPLVGPLGGGASSFEVH